MSLQTVADTTTDFQLVELGQEYEALVMERLANSNKLVSLVCNGALPLEVKPNDHPDHKYLGRGLINSYMTAAFNASATSYPTEAKEITHCLFRTTGANGLILDFEDRVWPSNSAGAYITLVASKPNRDKVLGVTNDILSLVHDVTTLQHAYLDMLLLPFVKANRGDNLDCETIFYVKNVIDVLCDNVTLADKMKVALALFRVSALDDEFARNLLGLIAVETSGHIPDYLPGNGVCRRYADLFTSQPRGDEGLLTCVRLKFLIELVDDMSTSGLLIANYLDSFLVWGGENEELESYFEFLEEHPELPEPEELHQTPRHRAMTRERILGASSISNEMPIRGGELKPAELGEINTADLEGRCVGTVDGRRVVAYFREGDGALVVQFKNARNYLFNVLHYARPGQILRTEVREDVVDRNKLVGTAALHLLLCGKTNMRLARFIVAAMTFRAISIKQGGVNGLHHMLGVEDGTLQVDRPLSPNLLSVFPVLLDSKQRLYIYHQGSTYRLKLRGMKWGIIKQDMVEAAVAFGNLGTGFPPRR